MKAYDIVAYTYRADTYCLECIRKEMMRELDAISLYPEFDNAEFALDEMAKIAKVNRGDESSFDSGNFPKVVFRDQFSGIRRDFCGGCNREIP